MKQKRATCILVLIAILHLSQFTIAEESTDKGFWDNAGDWISGTASDAGNWISGAASDAWNWTSDTASDAGEWISGTASDAWSWASGAATDAWKWTSGAASGTWNGVAEFFNPPSTEGIPTIPDEPELPEGTQKMYLGYQPVRTGLDNGYSGEKPIGRGDPHFGLTLGKFYVSGFSSALSNDQSSFIFLKTIGNDLELHFELAQDIDMLGGDTSKTINSDDGGYDKYFEISPTFFGRGTLIVRHTDYQNNTKEPQIYTDFLSAKMTGKADTVISLSEEGDYEVSLDYEIKNTNRILGTKVTKTDYSNYKLFFRFAVRNGNCMVFPRDIETREELKNAAVTANGFYLDLAYSRYLDINVQRSELNESSAGVTEDIRFNRPAKDGEKYTDEGIYTITVKNHYTGEETTKTICVGTDERLINYVSQGLSVEQIIKAIENH